MEGRLLRRACKLILAIFIICVGSSASAGSAYQFDVGGGMHYYAGLLDKSLAPNTAVAMRLGAHSGDEIFRWATSFYALSSSGESSFDDAGTSTTLDYKLLAGEFNIGFLIYPLGTYNKLPLQPFLGAAGTVHIASVSFDKDAVVSDTFPKSDTAMMFGYALSVGADLAFSKDWGIKFNVDRIDVNGTVATKTFSLGGQRVCFSLYFK